MTFGYGHIYLKLNQCIPLNLCGCFEPDPGDVVANISESFPATGSIAPIDYKNDGNIGFIFGEGNIIYIYKKEGPGSYSRYFVYQLLNNPQGYSDSLTGGALATADFNNDGYPDFVSGGVQGIIRLFINDRSQNFPYPPETPIINGPTNGTVNHEYIFSLNPITDLDGDPMYLKWDWGDGNISDWLGPYPSGKIISASHEWTVLGVYEIRAKLKDTYEAESNWSDPHTITITYNKPPATPSITGSEKGKRGVTYLYTFETTDPENDRVSYYVDWGDGSNSG